MTINFNDAAGRVLRFPQDFGGLRPGAEIVIDAEVAVNPIQEETNPEVVTDFVHSVEGNSLLTYQGWTLGGCHAAGKVKVTGHHAGPDDSPSQDALRVLEMVEAQHEAID